MLANAEKGLVRDDIIHQLIQWAIAKGNIDIFGASLSGGQFAFEKHLAHVASRYGMSIDFYCAEGTRSEYIDAVKNCPAFAKVGFMSLNELLFGDIQVDPTYRLIWRYDEEGNVITRNNQSYIKALVKKVCEGNLKEGGYYEFVWADYCGLADKQNLADCVKAMSLMTDGLFYATFSVKTRSEGGSKSAIKKLTGDLRCYDPENKTGSMANAIVANIQKQLKAKGIKHRLVYKVVYNGNGKTHMTTIGFEIKSRHVKTIYDENRTVELKEQKASQYSAVMNPRRIFSPERKNKNSDSVTMNTKEKKEQGDLIREMFLKGIDKETIAHDLGVTVRTVGSSLAWLKMKHRMV